VDEPSGSASEHGSRETPARRSRAQRGMRGSQRQCEPRTIPPPGAGDGEGNVGWRERRPLVGRLCFCKRACGRTLRFGERARLARDAGTAVPSREPLKDPARSALRAKCERMREAPRRISGRTSAKRRDTADGAPERGAGGPPCGDATAEARNGPRHCRRAAARLQVASTRSAGGACSAVRGPVLPQPSGTGGFRRIAAQRRLAVE
jgi:hypothetical protein